MNRFILLFLTCLLCACATKKDAAVPGAAASPTPSPTPAPSRQATKPPSAEGAKPKTPFYLQLLSLPSKLFPAKPKPPSAVPPQFVGTITSVNLENKFVLIDAASVQSVKTGDTLVCISNQQISSSLTMSALKSSPFIIADIANGTPSTGEKVYLQEQ